MEKLADAAGVAVRPHFGVNLLGQHRTWPDLRDAAIRIDELGFDSLWTWDQFRPFTGDPNGPMFEAWQLLAAWGASTSRVKVGILVTGVTYRHPAVLAKMVATLDHVTGGRAILGLGAAFNASEHAMYGIPFPPTGERLALLDEACEAIRMLLDRPVARFDGRWVKLADAVCEPKPIQARLPILVGGRGERKTLRTVARFADYWHCPPSAVDELPHKLEVLRCHCADVGRDPDTITPLVTVDPTQSAEGSAKSCWRTGGSAPADSSSITRRLGRTAASHSISRRSR